MSLALVLVEPIEERVRFAKALAALPYVSVVCVGSAEEAEQVARIEEPSALIVGARIGDEDATAVLERLYAVVEPQLVLVVDPGDLSLPPDPRVQALHTPFDETRLRRRIRRSLAATIDCEPLLGPAEFIQALCTGGHSGAIHCIAQDRPLGVVRVYRGEIWGAEDEEGHGLDALRRLLAVEGAVAVTQPLGDIGPREIEGRWEQLLLEAAQITDETNERSARVADHLRQARMAVLGGRLQEAADHFSIALELAPEDDVIRHNVERLRGLGFEGKVP